MVPVIYTAPPTVGICYVNRVIDGDTLECDHLRVRLCGIDAPEKAQNLGSNATAKLTQLAIKKNVRLVTSTTDAYGRLVAEIWLNKRLINAELVRGGFAYKYGSCPNQRTIFVQAEKSAIANKIGVWKTEQMKPWTYRKFRSGRR